MAEGRRLALVAGFAAGKSEDMILTELLPRENPMPKKTAQMATSPKKRASILPVPRVISVSCEVAVVIFTLSLPRQSYCRWTRLSFLRGLMQLLRRVLPIVSAFRKKSPREQGKLRWCSFPLRFRSGFADSATGCSPVRWTAVGRHPLGAALRKIHLRHE